MSGRLFFDTRCDTHYGRCVASHRAASELSYSSGAEAVMPNVIRANTNATTIMIGERAADWLRNS